LEKISVMLTLMPAAVASRMAGIPSGLAGILMNRLGRSRAFQKRFASSTLARVSLPIAFLVPLAAGHCYPEGYAELPTPPDPLGSALVPGRYNSRLRGPPTTHVRPAETINRRRAHRLRDGEIIARTGRIQDLVYD